MRKPLPLGEVALRSNDGEGKPVSQKYLHSDKHWLLSERCYRCAFCFMIASLPSQALTRQLPQRGSLGEEGNFPTRQCLPSIGEVARRRRDGEVPFRCGSRAGCPSYNLSVSLRSTAPLVGEPLAKRRSAAPHPVICTNTPKTCPKTGAGRAKRKKIGFPLAKRGKTRYSIVTV